MVDSSLLAFCVLAKADPDLVGIRGPQQIEQRKSKSNINVTLMRLTCRVIANCII